MMKKSKFAEPKRRKVGREKFVCDFDGKPLVGLSWDRGNGQYYFTYFKQERDYITGRKTRKDYSFGSDYQEAVFRFKAWREQTGKLTLSVPAPMDTGQRLTFTRTPEQLQGMKEILEAEGVDDYPVDSTYSFKAEDVETDSPQHIIEGKITTDKQYALHLLRQLLSKEDIRIEAIRLLKLDDLLPATYRTLPLKELTDYYMENHGSKLRKKRDVVRAVKHFVQITKKKNVNDITEDDCQLFRDMVAKSTLAPETKNDRFKNFRRVLRFYNESKRANGEKELIKTVLALCSVMEKVPDGVTDKPKSFYLDDLTAIFEQAQKNNDRELLTMFVVMLNCAYYPVDVRTLTRDMIREKDGITFIDYSRTKTRGLYVRINCLWPITVALLKEQMARHTSNFVFVSQAGTAYDETTLDNKLAAFWDTITYSDGRRRTAKHFRDTVTTETAFDGIPIPIVQLTLGHNVTNDKNMYWRYICERPDQQKPAADLLYKKFAAAIETIQLP